MKITKRQNRRQPVRYEPETGLLSLRSEIDHFVSGEKKEEKEEKKGEQSWRECSYGSFSRSIPLPSSVQTDKATASFRNGRLKIRMPKSEDAKKKRRSVEIKPE